MSSDDTGTRLLASARRAFTGQCPASLRALSLQCDGTHIRMRAVFSSEASDGDHEQLSCVASEVIADFPAPFTIDLELVTLDAPATPEHLRHVIPLTNQATA